jgi:hypothetical protein
MRLHGGWPSPRLPSPSNIRQRPPIQQSCVGYTSAGWPYRPGYDLRDLGDRGDRTLRLREELTADPSTGPELLCRPAGHPSGSHCWFLGGEADGIEGVRQSVRAHGAAPQVPRRSRPLHRKAPPVRPGHPTARCSSAVLSRSRLATSPASRSTPVEPDARAETQPCVWQLPQVGLRLPLLQPRRAVAGPGHSHAPPS